VLSGVRCENLSVSYPEGTRADQVAYAYACEGERIDCVCVCIYNLIHLLLGERKSFLPKECDKMTFVTFFIVFSVAFNLSTVAFMVVSVFMLAVIGV